MILFHEDNGFYANASEFVVFDNEPPANCNWEDWFYDHIKEARPLTEVPMDNGG